MEQKINARKLIDDPAQDVGGINFDSMSINVNRGVRNPAVQIKMEPVMLRQFDDAAGFMPVIINVQPLTDLPHFLGTDAAALAV